MSGRDGLLVVSDGSARLITREGAQEITLEAGGKPSQLILIDAMARVRAGRPPLTSAEDCYRAIRLVDQAYALARA